MTVSRSGKRKTGDIIERRRMHPYSPIAMIHELDNVFDALRRDFNDMYGNPFTPRFVSHAVNGSFRAPPMDFKDEGDRFVLVAEMPGMKKEDVDITLTDGHVEIVAEKKESTEEKGECYLCQERGRRTFKRSLDLPGEIVTDKAEARIEDGVLELVMPKRQPDPKKEATKLAVK